MAKSGGSDVYWNAWPRMRQRTDDVGSLSVHETRSLCMEGGASKYDLATRCIRLRWQRSWAVGYVPDYGGVALAALKYFHLEWVGWALGGLFR